MDGLPAELIFLITSFLLPVDIVTLQLVSRRLFRLARDEKLWRVRCFNESQAEALRKRRALLAGTLSPSPQASPVQAAASSLLQANHPPLVEPSPVSTSASTTPTTVLDRSSESSVENKRLSAVANWDPAYASEEVDWYEEYIHRHAPISLSPLRQPCDSLGDGRSSLEVRGMALFNQGSSEESRQGKIVVAPLDDGSVSLWNLQRPEHGSAKGRYGDVIARSRPGLLSINGQSKQGRSRTTLGRATMTSTGIVECVSVDNVRKKAYFAVQSGLNEVDLETLQVVSHKRFPYSIAALSETTYPVPLTVATTLSLHLHDPRVGPGESGAGKLLEGTTDCTEYAPMFQPGPQSIAHVRPHGIAGGAAGDGDIYVAGRFSSIMNYDRRYWPRLRCTLHSGARLSSMTTLPFVIPSLDPAAPTVPVQKPSASTGAHTIVACGEYNGRGSLELYGLSPPTQRPKSPHRHAQHSSFKNRQSASSSKLLSVAAHGTRLVFSDANGTLKWVERDGSTGVRQWNINAKLSRAPRDNPTSNGIFAAASSESSATLDAAIKLLCVSSDSGGSHLPTDDILLWTGERLALLTFSAHPAFSSPATSLSGTNADAGPSDVKAAEEPSARRQEQERVYGATMRRALEMQADEVRFMQGLGLGLGAARR
ncbi:MAG: hypothetical protein M1832_004951 [Thelocarpon impressellum]|nr:MAG: hypothetical protein M1832_004951 [Thelocarpon impressellum]